MTQIRRIAGAYGLNALILVAALDAALEVLLQQDSSEAPTSSLWFAVPAVVLIVLALLGRRRFPLGAPASLWLLAAGVAFVDGRLVTFTASVFAAGFAAAFLLGNLRDAAQARLGLVIVLGAAAIVTYKDPSHAASDLVFTPMLFGIGWVIGFALRERAEQAEAAEERASQAEREREAAARVAVAEERTRIARELHDVVAHAVSVMVLQVGAIRHTLPANQPEDREALEGVERIGRTALAEMRRLLGAMRRDGEDAALAPQPGLGSLGTLVEQVGGAGLSVRLHTVGEPYPLPDALDVSAFRIAQEGITNVLKHAGADSADVTVRYGADEVFIEVIDDGDGPPPGNGQGYGLVGIRERVKIYGGEMTADLVAGGGFALRARLPLEDDR